MKLGINFYVDFIALVILWLSVVYVVVSSTTLFLSWKNLKDKKIDEIDISYSYTSFALAYILAYINWVLLGL